MEVLDGNWICLAAVIGATLVGITYFWPRKKIVNKYYSIEDKSSDEIESYTVPDDKD